VVFTHHGEDYQREKWSNFARTVLRIGEFCAVRFANRRIAISANLAQRLSSRFGLRFDYIPNAVPRLLSAPSGKQLERLGLVPRKFVLHVGRLVPEKRQLDIIAAFKLLDFPDHRLVLVGGSDNEISGFPVAVSHAAATDSRVVLAGSLNPEKLSELYVAAKVFVLPSTHEGLPISLLEAMSFGLPVVVSDIDALSQLGLPPECYFPVMDVDTLAGRLNAILDTPDATRDWQPWLVDFDIENVARRTRQVYVEVCPQKEAPR
jgi:glycosyltransferase involved in cell wall biosynthesis